MTNLPGQFNESAPFTTTTLGINRILPIMSVPQHHPPPPPQPPVLASVEHQTLQLQGNHRRRLPEQDITLQQERSSVDSRQPSYLGCGAHLTQQHPSQVYRIVDGGMALDTAAGSRGTNSGQHSTQQIDPLMQQVALDSSDGSGNSSGAEGKALDGNSSGNSKQSKLTRRSTAEDWFNSFNRDVRGNQSYPSYYDNDSPYFMPNHHRKKHQQRIRPLQSAKSHHGGPPDQTLPPGFRDHAGILDSTEESNSDSFRSVIDDLTIKNQKLKKRLRKLEGLHEHTLQAGRLFEVRVHDLPEDKKTELERILQTFTASIDNESAGRGSSIGNNFTPGGRSSAIDSGYASVSRSANDSSGGHTKRDENGRMWASSQSNSEITKMKVVVRKLEQLFTGGEAVTGDRRVLQQQDISNLATAEEHEAKALAGEQIDTEGARGASLMSPPRSNQFIDSDFKESLLTADEPEQRPTRPLDLDPQREQVAEDNIEYLTHMTESSTKGLGVGDGWVYLNLIINLAQLHTINVTPPFVKKAIAAVSNKLELSSDGKMVRWRGGKEGTHYNSDSVPGTGFDGGSEQSPQTGSRKNIDGVGFESSGSRSGSGSGSGPGPVMQFPRSSRAQQGFHYKPIFAQSQSFEDDSSSCVTGSDTDPDVPKQSTSGESRVMGTKMHAGPIIFYKGGSFCTDFSSQPLREGEDSATRYVRATTQPLGSTAQYPPSPSTKYESLLYRPGMILDDEVMEIDGDDQGVIKFSPQFTATFPPSPPTPIEFEASGIGGILPADNFTINCQTKHYLLPENHGRLPIFRPRRQKRTLHRIPKTSIEVFYDQDTMTDTSVTSSDSESRPNQASYKHPLRHELLSANTLKLPPSSLPPASYIFASPSEDSSSNGETDDDSPQSSGSEGYFFHRASLDAYRVSSGEENEVAQEAFQRSPSSVATAGDGSRASSIFSDHGADDQTFREPLSIEHSKQSSYSSGNGLMVLGSRTTQQPDDFELDRPNLKRSRGSVISSSSNHQVKKSARMQSNSLQISGDDS